MTDLQLSLIAAGGVFIVGVFSYNKWQEYKAKKSVERAFASEHDDVLMRSGETPAYEGVDRRTRRKEAVFAGVATAYTLFLFDAAGLEFLLLATVILAPATLLYVKARSERQRRMFTPTEIALCAVIVAGGITGVVGLSTGFIAI